ncbi:MAG TPA: DNA repair exonuclease, partial [Kiloniellaceae bacterium]|nr:DNA repair exonuclease [Kiloniellaceae bacterium]
MTFRFLHTADIHLDSPLRSLALRDPEIAETVGNATRQAFVRTVDLCLEEKVDALMIAGDLYDGDLRSMKTAIFFGAQMRRLDEAGIRVFIVRGNHDAESRITKQLSLPPNVHVFSGRAEAIEIEGKGVVVHGVSFADPQALESL